MTFHSTYVDELLAEDENGSAQAFFVSLKGDFVRSSVDDCARFAPSTATHLRSFKMRVINRSSEIFFLPLQGITVPLPILDWMTATPLYCSLARHLFSGSSKGKRNCFSYATSRVSFEYPVARRRDAASDMAER